MNEIDRLRKHTRVRDAEQRLKKQGMTDGEWNVVLEHVAKLPVRWKRLSHETKAEATIRRQRLAKMMRKTAKAMRADPEMQSWAPRYNSLRPDFRGDGRVKLYQWLRICTRLLVSSERSRVMSAIETRRGNDLRSYVVKEAHAWIAAHARGRRAKNIETALLASAVLGEDITTNQVVQIRRRMRRRHAKSDA